MISQECIDWSEEAYEQWLEFEMQMREGEENALLLLQEKLLPQCRPERTNKDIRMPRNQRGQECLSGSQRRRLGHQRKARRTARSHKYGAFIRDDFLYFDIYKYLELEFTF